jgi:hypothetical protein
VDAAAPTGARRDACLSADRQVRGVMVQDQMQIEMGRGLGVDFLEEPDEFLVSMARQAVADLPVACLAADRADR